VINFPRWFGNTLWVSALTCVISTLFVLGVSFALSRMRFKGRKMLMNLSMILGLFPGFLSMIAVYFILQALGLSGSLIRFDSRL
jgi:arabinogalactan oligomer/maltooligosaccharide transport system permease protein